MDNAATIPSNIAQLSGPVIVGYLLHWGADLYYRAFPNDRKPIQCLVYTVYLLELVQTILITHDAFTNFGTGFGNTTTLQGVHFDWLTIPIMSGIVACIGQTFYAYRVYLLSKTCHIPVLIVTVSLLSGVSGIMIGNFQRQVGVVPPPHTRTNSVISALWLGGAALDDFIIAVSVTYYASFITLLRSDTGLCRTHLLVVKLIRLTIETGSLTAAVALINLALFFAFPDRPYFFTVGALLPKLYANTIFAVLNSRFQILGGRGSLSEDTTTHQSVVVNIRTGGTTRTLPPALVTITREIFPDSQLEELEMKDRRSPRISGSGQS
ncbi:hypothetical protein MSAN_02468500 [Mycena sanguinolenta]|uniref:DUF6534 domain-containing protein n=1 Tax=Mycena sanguinolenta TaxID=230812 RepID=A0A8H6U431_9AGAR|nr:hypothetical protein MSAN_02468500 [Mycena sanguinolenta]